MDQAGGPQEGPLEKAPDAVDYADETEMLDDPDAPSAAAPALPCVPVVPVVRYLWTCLASPWLWPCVTCVCAVLRCVPALHYLYACRVFP